MKIFLTSNGREATDRKEVFERNLREVIAHNSKAKAHSWLKGINAFSDMTHEEFAQYYSIVGKDQICTVAPPSLKEANSTTAQSLP